MKLRYDLIPPHSMHLVADAMTIGAVKHGDDTWREKPIAHHVGALLRHLYAYLCGEQIDTDGQHHLASVAVRAMMILELQRRQDQPLPPSL
jgi:hypothetical protein